MDVGGLEGRIEDIWGLPKECTPCLGMEFESEEAAFGFYTEYGRVTGFNVRRDYHTKSKKDGMMINRKFVCAKEGEREKNKRQPIAKQPRQETRTNCNAFMYISFKRELSKWVVTKFDDSHNHPLDLPRWIHMMPYQRKLCEAQGMNIDVGDDTGLSLKASRDLISSQVGEREFLGLSPEAQKYYLHGKRQRNLQYGEAGTLLRYLQKQAAEDPYFYHAVQLDVDEMITNVFWADHHMITQYGHFGDAVSFDTAFLTNKEFRPLVLFTGLNHHRMTVIFGAALLYDETVASFEWLFETFLDAMSGKNPTTIFTVQYQAIATAICQIMPDVCHGLCTSHLMQNALKHLGYLFSGGSKFSSDFKACIFEYEDETELIEAWDSLIGKYQLRENMWMKKTWEVKEKWAHVYMKQSFTAGKRSSQLSDSLKSTLRKYIKSEHGIVQFFNHFNGVVMDQRYQEVEAMYRSRQNLPKMKMKKSPMLVQAAKLYTLPIFDLFHDEVDTSLCCQVKQCHHLRGELSYVIGLYREEREYTVEGNVEVDELGGFKSCREVRCTCRKFESFGILCGHAIKVLDRMNVMEIPEKYILGRWRLDAKVCAFKGSKVVVDKHDPKLVISAQYRNLCSKMIKLAARSSEYEAAYQLVEETITDLCAKVDHMLLAQDCSGASGSGGHIELGTKELDAVAPDFAQAKSLFE